MSTQHEILHLPEDVQQIPKPEAEQALGDIISQTAANFAREKVTEASQLAHDQFELLSNGLDSEILSETSSKFFTPDEYDNMRDQLNALDANHGNDVVDSAIDMVKAIREREAAQSKERAELESLRAKQDRASQLGVSPSDSDVMTKIREQEVKLANTLIDSKTKEQQMISTTKSSLGRSVYNQAIDIDPIALWNGGDGTNTEIPRAQPTTALDKLTKDDLIDLIKQLQDTSDKTSENSVVKNTDVSTSGTNEGAPAAKPSTSESDDGDDSIWEDDDADDSAIEPDEPWSWSPDTYYTDDTDDADVWQSFFAEPAEPELPVITDDQAEVPAEDIPNISDDKPAPDDWIPVSDRPAVDFEWDDTGHAHRIDVDPEQSHDQIEDSRITPDEDDNLGGFYASSGIFYTDDEPASGEVSSSETGAVDDIPVGTFDDQGTDDDEPAATIVTSPEPTATSDPQADAAARAQENLPEVQTPEQRLQMHEAVLIGRIQNAAAQGESELNDFRNSEGYRSQLKSVRDLIEQQFPEGSAERAAALKDLMLRLKEVEVPVQPNQPAQERRNKLNWRQRALGRMGLRNWNSLAAK